MPARGFEALARGFEVEVELAFGQGQKFFGRVNEMEVIDPFKAVNVAVAHGSRVVVDYFVF